MRLLLLLLLLLLLPLRPPTRVAAPPAPLLLRSLRPILRRVGSTRFYARQITRHGHGRLPSASRRCREHVR